MIENLFGALLKHWRRKRGLSQLDLALAGDVSSRHISFLESGRAQPSEDMVLRLLSVLGVSLKDQNEALRAAGFRPRFATSPLPATDPTIVSALTRMMEQQEPYPLIVMDDCYNIVHANKPAVRIFGYFSTQSDSQSAKLNLFDHVFDPLRGRNFIANWYQLGSTMVARLHREALERSSDSRLWQLLDRALSYPDVPSEWKQFTADGDNSPVCPILLRRDADTVSFLTTVTKFSSPRDATLEQLRIESFFPTDDRTAQFCEAVGLGNVTTMAQVGKPTA